MNRFENGVSSAELWMKEQTRRVELPRRGKKLSPKFLHIFEWQIGTACNKKWHR